MVVPPFKYTRSNTLLSLHSATSVVHPLHSNHHHLVYTLRDKQNTRDHVPHLYSLNPSFNPGSTFQHNMSNIFPLRKQCISEYILGTFPFHKFHIQKYSE